MNYEILRILRNILLRSFVIGVLIGLILASVTMAWWDTWIALASTSFHTDSTLLTPLILKFFIDLRFLLLFYLLTPGLAIHWTLKQEAARLNLK